MKYKLTVHLVNGDVLDFQCDYFSANNGSLSVNHNGPNGCLGTTGVIIPFNQILNIKWEILP